MRAALVALALAVVVVAGGGWLLSSPPAGAQQPGFQPPVDARAPRGGSAAEVTSFVVPGDGGRQHLVVMDGRQHVLCVYHVDGMTGELSLKSVRNFHHDLQIEDYNGAAPSPREIRALLAPR